MSGVTYSRLTPAARQEIQWSGITVADYVRVWYPDGQWGGDRCGCPDDRCRDGYHHEPYEELRMSAGPHLRTGVAVSGHSAEKDAGLARELRLRLQTAEDMLREAQRRVSDAEEALDAHLESCAKPDVRSRAHSLNDCWCGMPHRRDDFL